jgi:hypothetical protein
VHAIAVAIALDEQRLVEVHRIGWVDGDEGDVAAVLARQARMRDGGHGGLLDLRRERGRQAQLALDVGHAALQCGILARVQAEAARGRHGGSSSARWAWRDSSRRARTGTFRPQVRDRRQSASPHHFVLTDRDDHTMLCRSVPVARAIG